MASESIARVRARNLARPPLYESAQQANRSPGVYVELPGVQAQAQIGRTALVVLAVGILTIAALNVWTRGYQR